MSTAVATKTLSPSAKQALLDATVDFNNMIIFPTIFEKFDRNGNPVIWYVRSNRMATRYYVVIWNYDRCSYQCSCGAGCKEHSHISDVSAFNHAKQVEQVQEVLHIEEYVREEIDEDAKYEAWKIEQFGPDMVMSRSEYITFFNPCGLEVA